MAHMVETMAYAHKQGSNEKSYQVPWHGLGVPVSNDMSPQEMMKAAGVDWQVIRHPTFAQIEGKLVATGRDVLVRSTDNRILTHITENWHENQNSVAFDLFTEWVRAGNMEMNSAGSLKDGNIVWALAKCKKSFGLFKKQDEVDLYLLFTNPHMYGQSIDIRATPIRVVCNNTLSMSLETRSDVNMKLNHTRKFDADYVKRTLEAASERMDEYQEKAEFISSKSFKMDELIQYYNQLFPMQTKDKSKKSVPVSKITDLSGPAQKIHSFLETQPGAQFGEGTWWSAYNSVTYALDHKLGRTDDTRMTSAWYGPNKTKKENALDLAVEYAKAA